MLSHARVLALLQYAAAFFILADVKFSVTAAENEASSTFTLEKMSVKGKWFTDSSGRTRLFHGFCDAGEETKRVGRFDGTNYLPVNLMQDSQIWIDS